MKDVRAHEPFRTVVADPPWRFQNRTGKMAPEHGRLARYGTMSFEEIEALPVAEVCDDRAHLYLWVPNALLAESMDVMADATLPEPLRRSSGTAAGPGAASEAAS